MLSMLANSANSILYEGYESNYKIKTVMLLQIDELTQFKS